MRGLEMATAGAASFITKARLLEDFDGDADFVREITLQFVSRCPALLEQIRSALK